MNHVTCFRSCLVLVILAVLSTELSAQYHFIPVPRSFAITSDGTFYRSSGMRMDDGKLATILRSTDQGRTWEVRARFDTAKYVADLVALDTVLYGIREGRRVVESVDGGMTWTDLPMEHKLGLPSTGTRFGEPLHGHPLIVIHDNSESLYLWDPATRMWSDSIVCEDLIGWHVWPSWLHSGELVATGAFKMMGMYDFTTQSWKEPGFRQYTGEFCYAVFGDVYKEDKEALYRGDSNGSWTWYGTLQSQYLTRALYGSDSLLVMRDRSGNSGAFISPGSETKQTVLMSCGPEQPRVWWVTLGPDRPYFLETNVNEGYSLICYDVWVEENPTYPRNPRFHGKVVWQDLPPGSPIHRVTDDHWLSVFPKVGQQQTVLNESRDHGFTWHPVCVGEETICTQSDALVVVNSNVSIIVGNENCDFISTDGAKTYQPINLQRIGTETRNVDVHDERTLTFASYDPTDQRWRHYRSTTLTGPATYLPFMDVVDSVEDYNMQPWSFITASVAYRVHFERDSMFLLRTTDDGRTTSILMRDKGLSFPSLFYNVYRLSDNEIVLMMRTNFASTTFWIVRPENITEPTFDSPTDGIDGSWVTSITRDADGRLIVVDHLGNVFRYDENDANREQIFKAVRTNMMERGKQDQVQALDPLRYPLQRAIIHTNDGFAACGEYGMYVSGTFTTTDVPSPVTNSGTIRVYPNPASSSFTIADVADIDDVRITDILGRPVQCNIAASSTGSQRIVTLNDAAPGLVLVAVRTVLGVRSVIVQVQ